MVGELVEGNHLVPYDAYYKDPRFPAWDIEQVLPAPRSLLQYGGHKYMVANDHDGQVMYYRRDLLNDPKHRAAFQRAYGRPLNVPVTWDEFRDVAAYFNGKDPSTLLDACLGALRLPGQHPLRVDRRDEAMQQYRASLVGTRILLVEDNPINQELARDLLSSAGVVLAVANNGQEALDLLAAADFDLVLMDCQMPLMDGYAATRALREQPRWRALPVIAMTANAMVGDREKVLAAGMNDHVAKPIEVDELFATLARWIRRPARDRTAAHALNARAAHAALGGRDQLYERLARMFLERETHFGHRFAEARAAADGNTMARLAHDLKSVAATLGAMPLSAAAAALEKACDEHASAAEIDMLVQAAESELQPVFAELRSLLAARD